MRKATMLVSLASILFLGVGVVIQVFSVPIELPDGAWPWLAHSPDVSSSNLLIIGILLALASLVLYVICWYQQEQAKQQQLKKLRIEARSDLELLRIKRAEANPYKREVWLRLIVIVSAGLSQMMPYVIDLLMRLSYQQQQQLQMTTQPAWLLLTPISILIYIILSRDFTKKSKAKTKG